MHDEPTTRTVIGALNSGAFVLELFVKYGFNGVVKYLNGLGLIGNDLVDHLDGICCILRVFNSHRSASLP